MLTRVQCLAFAISTLTTIPVFNLSAKAAEDQHVQEEADGVTLTAWTPQRTMLLWQPLVINLKIENKSLQAYEIPPQTGIPRGCVMHLIPPNSDVQYSCNAVMSRRVFGRRVKLEPGEACCGRIFVSTCILTSMSEGINKEGLVPLNRVGHYTVLLEWPLHTGLDPEPDKYGIIHYLVASSSVEFDVVEPAGRNLEAFNAWRRALEKAHYWAIPNSGPDAEALMTTYADTIYGQYVQYKNCMIERHPTEEQILELYAQALKQDTPVDDSHLAPVAEYNEFLRKYPEFPLADQIIGKLAAFGSIEEIQSLLDTLKQDYPDSIEIPKVEALLADRVETKRISDAYQAEQEVAEAMQE